MTPEKPKNKNADTISRIQDTAAEVFAEAGFTGARMDEIADRAGVNKATIYYHIGNKQALYARVLHEHFTSAGDRFDRILMGADSPQEKLSCYIRQIAHEMDQNPHKAIMILREAFGGGEKFPEIVASDLAGIISKLAGILAEGEKQGCFIHVSPFTIHLLVIGAMAFFRVSTPVREKIIQVLEPFPSKGSNRNGGFVDEIELLILRSLSK